MIKFFYLMIASPENTFFFSLMRFYNNAKQFKILIKILLDKCKKYYYTTKLVYQFIDYFYDSYMLGFN